MIFLINERDFHVGGSFGDQSLYCGHTTKSSANDNHVLS
jgi:hypothetical protein